ncbi:MAG: hypothetical protein ACREIA_24005 [Opitutaceae bacterium]
MRALADGRDPQSGAPLARESVFQQPQVIRALFTAATALEHAASKPPAAGGAWSEAEERKLVEQFDAGVDPADIAQEHGRTRGAIVSRLVKLGKIAKSEPAATMTAKLAPNARVKPDDGIPF